MAEVSRQFEVRQLLKAFRKGLISDELFEEQMREIEGGGAAPEPAAPPKTYRLRKRVFASERELLARFLDELRAGETLGGETFSAWCATSSDPALRGGLRVVAEREAAHGRMLAARLAEIGGRAEVSLPASFRESARKRLGSREVTDLAKIRELTSRLADIDAAVQPIRDVVAQIEEDHETRGLLELMIEDEISTLRWLRGMEKCLAERAGETPAAAAGPSEGTPAPASSEPGTGNGAAFPPHAG